MPGKSDYLEQALLDHVFRGTAYTAPATLHFSLHTADPSDTGSPSNEVTGTGYARVAKSANTSNFARSGSTVTNLTSVAFPTAGAGGWGTVTHAAIYDAASGGNLLYVMPLGASQSIPAGVQYSLPITTGMSVTED